MTHINAYIFDGIKSEYTELIIFLCEILEFLN